VSRQDNGRVGKFTQISMFGPTLSPLLCCSLTQVVVHTNIATRRTCSFHVHIREVAPRSRNTAHFETLTSFCRGHMCTHINVFVYMQALTITHKNAYRTLVHIIKHLVKLSKPMRKSTDDTDDSTKKDCFCRTLVCARACHCTRVNTCKNTSAKSAQTKAKQFCLCYTILEGNSRSVVHRRATKA
jgi:hypothetical protein